MMVIAISVTIIETVIRVSVIIFVGHVSSVRMVTSVWLILLDPSPSLA